MSNRSRQDIGCGPPGARIPVRDSLPRDRAEPEERESAKEARRITAGTERKTKENSVRDGKFRRFASLDTSAGRADDNDDDDDDPGSLSTRNEGEVVGRVAVPRGRRSTDCNVARNYVSAVSTADIPPPPSLRRSPRILSTCILSRPQPQEFGASM